MKINAVYVRVSTEKQSCEMQLHSIKAFLESRGITEYKIYQDEGESGTEASRPALKQLLMDVKQGAIESICVFRLDRLFRSLHHLIATLQLFRAKGVNFLSVNEMIDLNTPQGNLMMQMLGAFGEFERNILVQRIKAGQANARAKGHKIGAPPKITNATRQKVITLRTNGMGYHKIAKECSLSVSTVYKIVLKGTSVLPLYAE